MTGGVQPFTGRLVDGERPAVLPPAGALRQLVERFAVGVPAFAEAPVAAVWAGLIDMTPDALPVLDRVPGAEGAVVAMGFSGHGFCLGPVTGQIIAGMVRGAAPAFDLAPIRLARFDGWNAPSEAVTLHG